MSAASTEATGILTTRSPTAAAKSVERPALHGRRSELAAIEAAIEGALRGGGRLLMIIAEAGGGKTRLLEETEEIARRLGAAAHWGRCLERQGAPPYWPWTQVLRSLEAPRGPGEVSPQGAGGGKRWAEILDDASAAGPLANASPNTTEESTARARFVLIDGVMQAIEGASRDEPIVILLDDLHAADVPSLTLLQVMAQSLGRQRILVVGACRESVGANAGTRHSLLGEVIGRADRIRLRGLEEPEVAAVITEVLGDVPSQRLTRRVWEATEGNPFFVNAVVRLLAGTGDLRRSDLEEIRIPVEVRQAILNQAERLDDGCHAMLRAAAVLGRHFDVPTLRQVAGVDPDDALRLLDRCAEAGVIEVTDRMGGRRFRHALIRETLYLDIPELDRARIHLSAARVLEEQGCEDDLSIATLAHHYLRGAAVGGAEKAIDYASKAGTRCLEIFAYEDAIRNFEDGLRAMLWNDEVDESRRDQLLLWLGEAHRRSGDMPSARSAFMRVVDRARRRGDTEAFVRAALGATGFWTKTIRPDPRAISILEEAAEMLTAAHAGLRAWVLARLASELAFDGPRSYDRRVALVEEAIELAHAAKDGAALDYALNTRRLMPSQAGAIESRRYADAETERTNNVPADAPVPTLDGIGWAVAGYLERGELGMLDATILSHTSLGTRMRNRECIRNAKAWEAMRAAMVGDFSRAETLAQESYALGERLEFPDAKLFFLVLMALVRSHQGRLHEIETDLRALATVYCEFPIMQYWMMWLDSALGNTEATRRALDCLAANAFRDLPRDYTWHLAACMCATAAARLGDEARAALLYDLLLPYADRNIVAGNGLAMYDVVHRVLGQLARVGQRWDEAELHLGAAVDRLVRLSALPLLAQARCDLAEVRIARHGQGDSLAADLLEMVRSQARDLDLVPLAARASALSAAAALPAQSRASRVPTVTAGVFRLDGEYWSLTFEGQTAVARDNKGLRYIAVLLRSPDREYHVMDLVDQVERREAVAARTEKASDIGGGVSRNLGDAGEMLDPQARREYRRRLLELREELAEAEALNDSERCESLRSEMEFLARELASAVGMGGRGRRAASSNERARISVKHAITRAIARLESLHAPLARYLASTVRTGTFCCFRPDPRFPVEWRLFEPAPCDPCAPVESSTLA